MIKSTIKYLSFLLVASSLLLSSCGDTEEDDPAPITQDACDTITPFNLTQGGGTVDVLFLNTTAPSAAASTQAGRIFKTSAEAGTQLAISAEFIKTTGLRPQKFKVYASTCENTLGDVVDFSGQPKVSNNGETINLRNTDNQVRTLIYDVPTGESTVYLTYEVDESGGKFSYWRLEVDITGSGIVETFSNITLGGNSNDTASRMSSSLGRIYEACATEDNIAYIDITHAVSLTAPFDNYLCSNPARFLAPIGLSNRTATNCDSANLTVDTDGGLPSYWKESTLSFSSASLSSTTVSTSDTEYVKISAGGVYEFLNNYGKKGLVRVNSIYLPNNTNGSINIDVIVEK